MKWLLMAVMAALPLQWFVVAGPLRLHVTAMLLFLALVLVSHRSRVFSPVLSVAAPFVVANVVLCTIWIAAQAYHGLGFVQPLEQLVFLGVFVALATVVHRGLTLDHDRWVAAFRWSALTVTMSLVVGLSFSMIVNGINPVGVIGRTIAAADPEVLQRELFRAAFAGFGFDEEVVRGNLRHEVFGAVLVGMAASAACVGMRPFTSAGARALYTFSMALGVLLIVVSMSRSVIIAAAAWPLLALLRALLGVRLTPRLVGGGLVVGLGGAVLAATGFLTVIWVRFTQDDSSYQARGNLLDQALDNLGTSLLFGGVATEGASSHNFVIDTWLRAGVFAALAAAVVVIVLIGLFLSLASSLHREPGWMLPVTALLALPLVRMFTAGGGLIPPVSWVGLGLAAGYLVHRRLSRRASERDQPAGDLTGLAP
ncbi:hypothetical protein [Nocardioides coralli]|uniref:hypothetical protein n=1 Tax=Nocardioides coralli TaxID=2872154 RepID=UPI001CA42E5F|nr:hypothetical protein [Nocardioides coralli]QZY29799.1 hypothetical protein K6T13_03675 [Nocardioides coralli]